MSMLFWLNTNVILYLLSIASNTLKNLSLFYAWLLALEEKQTSLVVLDDVLLDYAPDMAEKLVSELKGHGNLFSG